VDVVRAVRKAGWRRAQRNDLAAPGGQAIASLVWRSNAVADGVATVHRDEDWRYASHEEEFARGPQGQDIVRKFELPVSERPKVLSLLDRYNLNAFSLFGSEESLMHTVAVRELLRKWL
jgi:hypothetical protein